MTNVQHFPIERLTISVERVRLDDRAFYALEKAATYCRLAGEVIDVRLLDEPIIRAADGRHDSYRSLLIDELHRTGQHSLATLGQIDPSLFDGFCRMLWHLKT